MIAIVAVLRLILGDANRRRQGHLFPLGVIQIS